MSQRRILSLSSLIIILALLLSACGAATEAAPKPTSTPLPVPPTYTPIPEEVATEEVVEEVTEEPAATEEPVAEAIVNAWGVTLPEDAAPLDQQFIRIFGSNVGDTPDFAVGVYKRPSSYMSILSTPLVRLDKNFDILPGGALSWEPSEDGKTWTFHLNPALTWSDQTPVTADDVVFTMQYMADPVHAWDFAWFWSDLVNFDECVAGTVPLEELGVKKVDDYTVTFTTEDKSPYFPSKALYVRPLSKKAYDANGEYYNSTPETSVSSSPWILTEWTKGKRVVFSPNTNYTGDLKPFIENLVIELTGDYSMSFSAYQANEIDWTETFTPAEVDLISADAQLNAEYHPGYGDFRTYYLGYNTYAPPFDNILVRQAFAKAIDRDSIIANVVGRQGMAAYSFLMPGFPAADAEAYKALDVNKFDVAAAKQLLADAGYPEGQGFPKLELWLRNEGDFNQSVANAIAAMLTENLGIQVEVSNKENKLFMDTLNAHELPFYFLSYGFDYLDPSNMLGIWTSNGRHAWKVDQFDTLVREASALTGDDATRTQMFKDAEKILVEDVGAIFIYHATPGNMYKPYMVGSELEPDRVGLAAWHWPGLEDIGMLFPTLYISKDVENYDRKPID